VVFFQHDYNNLFLQVNTPYIVKFIVTNQAGLSISKESAPILFDSSQPTAGHVVDGVDFINDKVWFGSSTTISGDNIFSYNNHHLSLGLSVNSIDID
jgi:hypothetical protein